MKRVAVSVLVLALALLLPVAAGAKLPPRGVLVPGRSLGGVELGAPAAAVRAALGSDFGVCRGCAETTWYYTYRRFTQEGLAVEFRDDRVDAVFTLWRPTGWHTSRSIALGAAARDAELAYPGLRRESCRGYRALVARRGNVVTVLYVVDENLWGFALQRADLPVCR